MSGGEVPFARGVRAGIAARGMDRRALARVLEETIPPGGSDDSGDAAEAAFDARARLAECAAADRAPDAEERPRFAEFGLVYLGPEQDGFRVCFHAPDGNLEPGCLRALADLSQRVANGSVGIDGRGGLSLRVVSVIDAPEAWRRLEAAGLRMGELTVQVTEESGERTEEGIVLSPPDGRLLSGQMNRLADVIEAGRASASALRLISSGALILAGCGVDRDLLVERCSEALQTI